MKIGLYFARQEEIVCYWVSEFNHMASLEPNLGRKEFYE